MYKVVHIGAALIAGYIVRYIGGVAGYIVRYIGFFLYILLYIPYTDHQVWYYTYILSQSDDASKQLVKKLYSRESKAKKTIKILKKEAT